MLPALMKVQELKAQQDTTAAIARINAKLDAIEAGVDRLLAIVEPLKPAEARRKVVSP